MDALEILQKVRDHISDPKMWYKGGYSENGKAGAMDGEPCCIIGALCWAAETDIEEIVYRTKVGDVLKRAGGFYTFADVAAYNDYLDTSHEDILALMDRAIEITKEEQWHGQFA